MALRMETIAEICALVDGRICYSSHFTNIPSTATNPHCGNFTSSFLIAITSAGSSFQHESKKSNPGFSPEFAASLSFCIRSGRTLDLATIASCDHFSALVTDAAEPSPSSTTLTSTLETEFSTNNEVGLLCSTSSCVS